MRPPILAKTDVNPIAEFRITVGKISEENKYIWTKDVYAPVRPTIIKVSPKTLISLGKNRKTNKDIPAVPKLVITLIFRLMYKEAKTTIINPGTWLAADSKTLR